MQVNESCGVGGISIRIVGEKSPLHSRQTALIVSLVDGRQTFPYLIKEGLLVTRAQTSWWAYNRDFYFGFLCGWTNCAAVTLRRGRKPLSSRSFLAPTLSMRANRKRSCSVLGAQLSTFTVPHKPQ